MNRIFNAVATQPARSYRLAPQLYLERFGDEALLLVGSHDRLLTVNAAAADLFDLATKDFASSAVTRSSLVDWLAGTFDLPLTECRRKSRELLAFALRNRLLIRLQPT